MKYTKFFLFPFFFCQVNWSFSQFYTELISLNQQLFFVPDGRSNNLSNTAFNAMAPIVKENGDIYLFRCSFEELSIKQDERQEMLWSLALPVGYQRSSKKNKDLRWTALIIPKWAGGNNRNWDDLSGWQLGCYGLATWSVSDRLKYKAGVYINQEFFGTFVVPMIGIDWKPMQKLQVFGTLPNSMKVLYSLTPKMNVGLVYRSMTRTFRNGIPDHWIRFNEMEMKGLFEVRMKQSVFFVEGGYFIGKSPLLYSNLSGKQRLEDNLYPYQSKFWMVNLGYAFRIGQ